MAKRLNEFCTSSNRYGEGLHLFAWADYKRGDMPDSGEIDYICRRVSKVYPTAELVNLTRSFIPEPSGREPKFVRWEFKWIVFNKQSEVRNE